jgi:hypothetical protein
MHKEKKMEILKKIKMINILSPLNNNSKCLKNNFHQRYQFSFVWVCTEEFGSSDLAFAWIRSMGTRGSNFQARKRLTSK